ncbi:MAG TPA: DNA internalization-related competence protein ComEC/Rec2 [Gemmatimonadales bacterium]|nr:DNA internalization-related competence protein ComEC/Rec2 [Gemmatimonadales bacterium]
MTPRPAILFTLAYGAGLATGLLRFGGPVGGVVILGGALAAAAAARHSLLTLLAAAALVGRGSAELAWAADAGSCAARLPAGRLVLMVRLREPAPVEGGRLEVTPVGTGCVGAVGARWPAGDPRPAGTTSRAEATWIPRPGIAGRAGGVLVVAGAGPGRGSPGPAERLRTVLSAASRALYGGRAALVDALMLGRRGGIDPELQDRFAQSGLVHLLSISGFHVGLIGAWVFLVARLLRARREPALILAATVSTAYVAFLGWPAPATRAAALAVTLARCRVRQRHVRGDELLAATCLLVLVIDPWAALDLGGWLSAAALWGATRFSRWTDGAVSRNFAWRTLGSSVGATLATAPITAWSLGTVAPIGVALNFAAIPIAAVAVPGVLLSLLLQPIAAPLARPFAAGAGLMLHLLELVARLGAAIPGGHQLLEPGSVPGTVPWLAALAVGLWVTASRNTPREAARRSGWAFTAVVWIALARTPLGRVGDGGPSLALHFLDVGQGDAAAIRTPRGHWILVDAGPADERADAGRRVVAPFLERQGARSLTLAVVSHAHADHLGGLPAVMGRLPTGMVIEPGADVADPRYTRFLDRLLADRVPWHPARLGDRFELDGVRATVLHPEPGGAGWGEDVNEDSLVLLIEYGDFQALFAGDAGFPAEAAMHGRLRQVDLLKVGHHGSRGSTGDDWLDALAPPVAVISLGRNDYGHPASATLARLQAHGVAVHRTDREGTITVVTDGHRMTVRSGAGTATYDVR